MVFAGINRDGEIIANMIEGGFDEAQEDMVLEAFRFAKPYIKQLIDFQNEIAKSIGKTKMALKEPAFGADYENELRGQLGNDLKDALYQKQKDARQEAMDAAKTKLEEYVAKTYPEDTERLKFAKTFFEKEIDNVLHEVILNHGLTARWTKY